MGLSWIQEQVDKEEIEVRKIKGEVNPADLLMPLKVGYSYKCVGMSTGVVVPTEDWNWR